MSENGFTLFKRAHNLDHYCHDGPLARTVEDCRLLENVMAGPHREDIVSLRPKLTIPAPAAGVSGWKIAMSSDLGGFEVDDEVRADIAAAAETFRALGATVQEVAIDLRRDELREAARAHFGTIFGSLISQSLPEHRQLMTPYAIAFAEDASRPHVGYYRSLEIESAVWAAVAEVLEEHRLLIVPAFGVPALKASMADYDFEAIYRYGLTLPFNMCSRCPVLVVPSGRSREGLPLGVQIVGRTYDDPSVFSAAAAFSAALPWFDAPARRPTLERSLI